MSGYSAAWSSAFDWGSKGREFKSLYPDHFFAQIPGKKMVNEDASLHFTEPSGSTSHLHAATSVLHIFAFSDLARRSP